MRIVLIILYLHLVLLISYAQKTKVLFIGNSYTGSHNLPFRVQELALSMGDSIEYDMAVFGGYTFNLHSTNTTTLSKIYSKAWDYVVLQEQSQIPALSPSYVAANCFPYAHKLDSHITKNNACSETVFFMTWGRKNGDAMNCASYPPVCTYNGMQARLRQSYLQMATNEHGSVAPVGAAWKMVRDSFPSINLYEPDESHPTEQGTYLAACVFYCTLFHKSCVGSSYIFGSVTPTEAYQLQYAATRVTLDSLATWQGTGDIPHAQFDYTLTGATATFNNQSMNATNYLWDFGDSFSSTAVNPIHTYSSPGTYVVTLRASNSCKAFTTTDTLTILPLQIDNEKQDKHWNAYPNPFRDVLYLNMPESAVVSIYAMNGQKISSFYVHQGMHVVQTNNWKEGRYMLVFTTQAQNYYYLITK
ncbi:MAG: PKD domain-containing protein [Bacteroidia bacterium]|nr:PKD domain-containing protein [Bacteroidia bacterium]MDW8346322.1 PKD domain-containing protein [Bacteroidia bacterium]